MQEKFLLKMARPIAGRARNAAQAAGGEEYTVGAFSRFAVLEIIPSAG